MVPHDSRVLPEFPRRRKFNALIRDVKAVAAKNDNQWDSIVICTELGSVGRIRSIAIFGKYLYSAADSNFCL